MKLCTPHEVLLSKRAPTPIRRVRCNAERPHPTPKMSTDAAAHKASWSCCTPRCNWRGRIEYPPPVTTCAQLRVSLARCQPSSTAQWCNLPTWPRCDPHTLAHDRPCLMRCSQTPGRYHGRRRARRHGTASCVAPLRGRFHPLHHPCRRWVLLRASRTTPLRHIRSWCLPNHQHPPVSSTPPPVPPALRRRSCPFASVPRCCTRA